MQTQKSEPVNWSNAALYWEKHRDTICQFFAPVARALIEEAAIAPGWHVLDIASGSGEPALTIAQFVGPAGKVRGIDPIPEMVAAANRAANALGLSTAKFEVAYADRLPYQPNTFDALVCRFGVMFIPSPLEAMTDMLRVLKPGRKLAFAVWGYADSNPFFVTTQAVLDRYVPAATSEPDAPTPFRFAEPGKLLALLNQAGAIDTAEHLLEFPIEAPFTAEHFLDIRLEMSEKLREALTNLPVDRAANLKRDLLEAIQPYATPAGIRMPGRVRIVSGSKPGY